LNNRNQWDAMDAATFAGTAEGTTIEFRVRNGETLNADGTTTPVRPETKCTIGGTSDAPVVVSVSVDDRG
jgi:hypothetical protein